jgi:RIO kinase 1
LAKFDVNSIMELDMEIPRKFERREKDADNRKTYDEVFDRATLMVIYKLITDKILSSIDYPVSTGKEANIFKGTTPEGDAVAIKIYRLATATFKNILRYIDGDTRFKNMRRDRRSLIYAWAKKEFRNLQRMLEVGVRVPKPIISRKNILVMEFIGDNKLPAPELRQVMIPRPATNYKWIISQLKILYSKAGMVHGDLSEYNILVNDDDLVLIDVGQSLLYEHPMATELLINDVKNITHYFKRHYKIRTDPKKILDEILSLRANEDGE